MESSSDEDVLVFVVHGMGQRRDKFYRNLGFIGKASQELSAQFFHEGSQPRLHFIPIEWHVALHQRYTVDARMSLITLPTVPFMRHINNEYLADVLYYYTPYHGRKILEIVVNEINRVYAEKMKELPKFKGRVILFGHSLGGVICYDILCNQPYSLSPQSTLLKRPEGYKERGRNMMHVPPSLFPKLKMKPVCLVAVGSPVAAVMIMRGQVFDDYHLPSDIPFYNIFHPYDVIAYRYEPIANPKYVDVEPVMLPHWNNQRIHVSFKPRNTSGTAYKEYLPDISSYLPSMPSFNLNLNMMQTLAAYSSPDSRISAAPFLQVAREMVSKQINQMVSFFNQQQQQQQKNRGSDAEDDVAEPMHHSGVRLRRGSSQDTYRPSVPDTKRQKTDGDDEQEEQTIFTEEDGDIELHPNRFIDVLESISGIGQGLLPAQNTDKVTIEQPSLIPKHSPMLSATKHDSEEVEQWDLDDSHRPPIPQQLRDDRSPDRPSSPKEDVEEKPHAFYDLSAYIARSVSNSVMKPFMDSFKVFAPGPDTDVAVSAKRKRDETEEEIEEEQEEEPLPPIPQRFDHVLQVNLLEHYSHEYLAGIPAHFSYWSHKDVPFHLLRTLFPTHFRNVETSNQ